MTLLATIVTGAVLVTQKLHREINITNFHSLQKY